MSLEGKLRLAAVGTVLVGCTLLFGVLYFLVSRCVDGIDERQISHDVARARIAISDYLVTLKGKAGDWSQWDESYEYVVAPTTEFVERNVPTNSLVQLDLNLVVFLDASGKVVHAKAVDASTGNEIPVPPPFDRALPVDSPLLRPGEGWSGVTGLYMLDGKCLFLAARPIVTSAGQGPPHGTLIFARFLDDSFVARLRTAAHMELAFRPYDGDPMPRDFREARDALESFEDVRVTPLDGDRLSAFALVAGVDGRPALLLRVDGSRAAKRAAGTTLPYLAAALGVFAVLLAVVLCFVVGRAVRPAPAAPAPRLSSASAP
jgi:adenylate cyclase